MNNNVYIIGSLSLSLPCKYVHVIRMYIKGNVLLLTH